jgi:two-component system, NarL family, nitrate/nitrite response regulator NarL
VVSSSIGSLAVFEWPRNGERSADSCEKVVGAMVLRAVVVDELPLICDGIVASLTASRDWLVTDRGVSAADAVRLVDRDRTNMIVFGFCDVDQALEAIAKIIAVAARVNIVCLAPEGAEGSVQRLLRAGARGCLSRKTNGQELMRCVSMVQDGGNYVSPGLAAHLLCQSTFRPRVPQPKASHPSLTSRELEILHLVAAGESNKAIARNLEMTEKSVKRYMTHIMQKIQVRNRLQAALYLEENAMVAAQ